MSKMPRIIRPKGIMSHTNYSKRFLGTCRGRTAIKFARDTEYICPSSLTDILIILTKYFSLTKIEYINGNLKWHSGFFQSEILKYLCSMYKHTLSFSTMLIFPNHFFQPCHNVYQK